ncbi:MAG: LicD family protein [Lachnospiraceae bacterium]|nr:LicD family protein [Lachnospiraceae bacterium]
MNSVHNKYCQLENLQFDEAFFDGEEREGFYVQDLMKRFWAAQLAVLAQIDRICKKYDIKWYMDCGTLLGAVRHSGYIPWDDDLDILMTRSNYERFFAVASDELPEEYDILTIQAQPEYFMRTGRVINSHEISFDRRFLDKNFGCPVIAGVDIFPLDGLAADPDEEEARRHRVEMVDRAMVLCAERKEDQEECISLLEQIDQECHVALDHEADMFNQLRFVLEEQYSCFSDETAEDLALMVFWMEYRDHKYPKRLFSSTVYLPFEGVLLPAPVGYEELLRIEYGDYMRIFKGGGLHDYPVYHDQEEKVEKNEGRNPMKYRITSKEMDRAVQTGRNRKTIARICQETMKGLQKSEEDLLQLIGGGSERFSKDFLMAEPVMTEVRSILQICQEKAIEMGNRLETKDGSDACVHGIEDYCEAVYRCYENPCRETASLLQTYRESVQEQIEEFLDHRKKEVLFITCRRDWWKQSTETVYKTLSGSGAVQVYVMPIPYYRYNQYGDKTKTRLCDESSLYGSGPELVSVNGYSIAERQPDMIVIEYPYDAWSMSHSIPNFFYAENLLQYTDKLIYVPPLLLDTDFGPQDKAMTAMAAFMEQPAVVFADEIWVSSDKMRDIYIGYLSGLTGQQQSGYWENRIKVMSKEDVGGSEGGLYETETKMKTEDTWQELKKNKKLLLFHVAVSSVYSNGEASIEKIRESIEVIEASKDQVFCVFSLHPTIWELERIDPKLWEEFKALIDEFKDRIAAGGNGLLDDHYEALQHLSSIDAYYGDGGHLAHLCRLEKIPVMIRLGA